MKDELTPYFAPPEEIVFTLSSRSAEPTQVWRVPVEPRIKITRGGDPPRDWPLLLQTGGALLAVALLSLWFLAQKPAPRPLLPTSAAWKIAPPALAKAPAPRRCAAPRFFNPNAREPRFTVPPCAPTK